VRIKIINNIMRKKEKIKILVGVISAVVLIFILLSTLAIAIYKYNSNSHLVRLAEKIIPFPAVYIRGAGFISFNEIKNNVSAVKKFYESQDFEQVGMRVDFSTEQGQKRLRIKEKEIINKMIENKIIEDLAQKRGVKITDRMVEQQVADSISQFGNREKLVSDLARLYGWTLNDFEQKVVKPELYAKSLAESFASEVDTENQQKKANSLWEKTVKNKKDFAQIARESSEGKSAENGGDLGWSTREQLVEPVAEKSFSMKIGEISDVISSPLGFHIIKLEEKKIEDGKDMMHLRQIFVKTTTFADWLKEKMKDYGVVIFLHDFQWNTDEGQAEFANAELREFEKNLSVNSQGDPSVFP